MNNTTDANNNLSCTQEVCPVPFSLLAIKPEGFVVNCPYATSVETLPASPALDINKNVWQGPTIKKLRDELLKGEEPDLCSHCVKLDKSGQISMKRVVLNQFKGWDFKLDYNIEDGNQFERPIIIDLSPSYKCEQSCITCSPFISSLQRDEYIKNLELRALINCDPYSICDHDILENDYLLNNLIDLSKNALSIRISGGEPLLSAGCKKYLKELSQFEMDYRFSIDISTALISYDDDFIKALYPYNIFINVGIDAVGTAFEYLKYPGKFKEFENNLKKLLHASHALNKLFEIQLIPLISALSIFELSKLIDWWQQVDDPYERKKYYHYNFISWPEVFDLNIVPIKERKKIANELEKLEYTNIGLENVIDRLRDCPEAQVDKKEIIHWLVTYEKVRNNSIKKAIPDFYKIFENDFKKHINFDESVDRDYLYFDWSIVDYCNLDCEYCILQGVKSHKNEQCEHLYIKNIEISVAKRLKELAKKTKILQIHLTGGEPLLAPNIEKVLEILFSTPNVIVCLTTNFILVDRIKNYLKKFARIHISTHLQCRTDNEVKRLIDNIKKYGPIIQKEFPDKLSFSAVNINLSLREIKYLKEISSIIGDHFFLMEYVDPVFLNVKRQQYVKKDIEEFSLISKDKLNIDDRDADPCMKGISLGTQASKYKQIKGNKNRVDGPFNKRCSVGTFTFLLNPDGLIHYDFCDLVKGAKTINIFSVNVDNFNQVFNEDMHFCKLKSCHCNYNILNYHRYLDYCINKGYLKDEIFSIDEYNKQFRKK